MKQPYPRSEDLSKAAAAAKRREEEEARSAEAQSNTRAAEGEERLQEVREDIAARELRVHLSGVALPDEGLVAGGGGSGRPPPPAPVVGDPPWWNHRAWAIISVVALILALGLWLACHERVVAAGEIATNAEKIAKEAKAESGEAKTLANKGLADISQAKADAANAVTIANEAKVAAAGCGCGKKEKKKAVKKQRAAVPGDLTQTAKLPSPPQSSAFWGWVHPQATATHKRACFADRLIVGMPAQCSSVEVFPRQGNETEVDWNARVAAKNGIYVGAKDSRGTITGTRFGRVQVK